MNNLPDSPRSVQSEYFDFDMLDEYDNNGLTRAICLEFVSYNGLELRDVPPEFIDQEMCDIAVKQHPFALRYVPEQFVHQQMCDDAVLDIPIAIRNVPKQFITKKMCETSADDGRSVKYIPKELMTDQLMHYCMASCIDNGHIRFLRQYLAGLVSGYCEAQDVPKELLTPNVLEQLVKENGMLLDLISMESRTQKICNHVLNNTVHAIPYVPDQFIDQDIAIRVVSRDGHLISELPESELTDSVIIR